VRRVPPLAAAGEWPRRWPRPVRLLSPPERVDNVVALLPDQPPRRFTWRGRAHKVAHADGPERIHGEWWRRSGEADAVRDYFQVEDEEGARFWLYRRGDGTDPRTGDLSWWLQGTFG
jgi:protein ImuB